MDRQTITDAYQRGRDAGTMFGKGLDELIKNSADFLLREYPLTAGMDLTQEVLKLDRERLASPPDPTKFPETRGLPEAVEAERRGFREATGANDFQVAYFYSWSFFYSRRINTRYVGVNPPKGECSAAYIADSAEGGPLYGRNWDVSPNAWARGFIEPPREGAADDRKMFMKGVSCSVFLDDEPDELFPVDVFSLMPKDCKKVGDAVEFLTRYRDFWGPGNQILVDADHESVAIEKANCRMGVRPSKNGASAVGAVSFLVPEMRAFKEERGRLSIARRGWTIDNAPDWKYWKGADERYERLLTLVDRITGKPTLQDLAEVMTDHAVPYPARVCLAGESDLGNPEDREWTMCSHTEVLEGPNRRIHFYAVEGNKPCYEMPPYLIPGKGVEIKPEWKVGTRALPPTAKSPRPRIHAEYPAIRMML